jgi:hypothetical protein
VVAVRLGQVEEQVLPREALAEEVEGPQALQQRVGQSVAQEEVPQT